MSRPAPVSRRSAKSEYIETVSINRVSYVCIIDEPRHDGVVGTFGKYWGVIRLLYSEITLHRDLSNQNMEIKIDSHGRILGTRSRAKPESKGNPTSCSAEGPLSWQMCASEEICTVSLRGLLKAKGPRHHPQPLALANTL